MHKLFESRRFRRPFALALTVLALAALAVTAGGCGKKGASGAAPAAAQTAPAGQNGAKSSGPPQPPVVVAVAAARSGPIASYYKATATLEAEKQAQVLARVGGVVSSLAVEEGDQAREGGLLLQIDNAEYQLRVDQAAARTATLQAQFDRTQQMLAQQLTSAQEFETAKSELAAAKSEEGLARLNLSYTSVAAPFSGKVTRRLVNVGQTVSVGTPLFEMADFDPLLARVHVPAKEFKKLQADQPVELRLDSTGELLQGRIKLVSPIIDPQSGTIKVTIEIPSYPAGVRPGDFAEVQIVTERHDGATLVPRLAVINEKGEDFVYVAGDSTAAKRVVKVGFSDNDHAEIVDGLSAGDVVVVKGQRSLKDGAPIKVLDESAATVAKSEGS